jgi:hypothetical protein
LSTGTLTLETNMMGYSSTSHSMNTPKTKPTGDNWGCYIFIQRVNVWWFDYIGVEKQMGYIYK